MKRVGELVGVEERFLVRAMRGTLGKKAADSTVARQMAIHQRFYTALALHDLVNEMSLAKVASKYGASKGKQLLIWAKAVQIGLLHFFIPQYKIRETHKRCR